MQVLVVEDHESVAEGILLSLKDQGYHVGHCDSAAAAIDRLNKQPVDLVILDLNLRLSSGLDVLRHLKAQRHDAAVIILSARNAIEDRIEGLDLGADDYLSKPFVMSELLARVRAHLRRVKPSSRPDETVGQVLYSPTQRSLFALPDQAPLNVPKKELALFEHLLANLGQLVTKQSLVDHLYGMEAEVDESVVEIYISRLRKRLSGLGIEIKTARGLGYLMQVA